MHPKFALYLLGINYSISDKFIKQNKIDLTAEIPPAEELLFQAMPLVMSDLKALSLTGIYLKLYGSKLSPGKFSQVFKNYPVKISFLSSLLIKVGLEQEFKQFIQAAVICQDQDFNTREEFRELRWRSEKLPDYFKLDPSFIRFNLKVTHFELGEVRKLRTTYLDKK